MLTVQINRSNKTNFCEDLCLYAHDAVAESLERVLLEGT